MKEILLPNVCLYEQCNAPSGVTKNHGFARSINDTTYCDQINSNPNMSPSCRFP